MCAKINDKIFKVARRFIEELAEEPVKVFSFMEDEQTFICNDEDNNIVFVRVTVDKDEFSETPREEREAIMCKGMQGYHGDECLVRFNELSMIVVSDSRAFIRYEVAAH